MEKKPAEVELNDEALNAVSGGMFGSAPTAGSGRVVPTDAVEDKN